MLDAVNLVRDLTIGEERSRILNGISFTVDRGEWVAVTGPSGSGKSTLLGIVAGLDMPDSGQVIIDGVDVTKMDEDRIAAVRNQSVGIVFQSFNLLPTLTAQENVEAPLYVNAQRRGASRRARELLDLVGLSDRMRHLPHQLSGGQQQRVAIARALANAPPLLLADEPTGNLDSHSAAQVLDLFQQLRAALGLTLFVVTHDSAVSDRANRVLHVVDGQLTDPPERSHARSHPDAHAGDGTALE